MNSKKIPDKVDIKGFEGVYYATPEGKIYRYPEKPRPLTVNFSNGKGGYVALYKNGKRHDVYVKKIMRECFFPQETEELRVINEKKNLSIWNLRPSKPYEKRHIGSCMQKPVVRIDGDDVRFYSSIAECARDNYISSKSVKNYCQKKSRNRCDSATYMWEEDYMSKYGNEYEVSCD